MTDIAMPETDTDLVHTHWCNGVMHRDLGEDICSSRESDVAGIGIWAVQDRDQEIQIRLDPPKAPRLSLAETIALRDALDALIDEIQGGDGPEYFVVGPRTSGEVMPEPYEWAIR